MRNFAIVIGIFALVAGIGGCVNDPTLSEETMSQVDTATSTASVDKSTATVVSSGTETATQ